MTTPGFMEELERDTAIDAARVLAKLDATAPGARGLFIDCGSNLGQGFSQFVRHYPLQRFDYILIEPNPNCIPTLEREARRLLAGTSASVQLLQAAAGVRSGTVKFFGLEVDPTSQGGSMLRDHNSRYYQADEDRALEVPCFSLAALIRERATAYAAIALKLDIEGGEYEVLPDLISKGVHRALDAAYIEFHSQYMAEPDGTRYRLLEDGIRARLRNDGLSHRIWV